MKSFLSAATIALAAFSASAPSAHAAIEFAKLGDTVILNNGPGANGGIFYVDVVGKASTSSPYNGLTPNFDFPTFCVEITEHIALGSQYKVAGVSTVTVATGKNLGSFAAWLYAEFLKPALGMGPGLTAITGWGGNADQDANAIQRGIWKSMGWDDATIAGALGAYDATFLTNLQTAYKADTAWTGLPANAVADAQWNLGTYTGNVRIMNLTGPIPGTGNAQDQLVMVSPEPLSLAVWSLMSLCVGGVSARSRWNRN